MNKEQKRKSRAICLDDWEKQIIYGSLLGKAFIVDPSRGLHCYMVIRHSKSHDKYPFLYKTQELKAFARSRSVYEDKNDYRWTSISHQDFDAIRGFCYKDGKKFVTMDWLDTLRDVSLMIWYLDCGRYEGGELSLNIVNLKNSGDVISRYFNEVGMSCRQVGGRMVFDEKGKKEFLRVIAHRVPSMLRHVLEKYNSRGAEDEKSLQGIFIERGKGVPEYEGGGHTDGTPGIEQGRPQHREAAPDASDEEHSQAD